MLLRSLVYSAMIACGAAATSLALDANHLNSLASAQLKIGRSTELAWKSVLERLSFSMYGGASDAKANVFALYAEAERYETYAVYCTVVFFSLAAGLLVYRWYAQKVRLDAERELTIDLLTLAAITLLCGLIAPILALKAYADVPLLGEVVFKYQAKSVLTTVGTLFRDGAVFVALLLSVFSIAVPVVKLGVSVAIVQRRWPRWHRSGLKFIRAIGKWSMTDVFVVAVLVAYFAIGGDEFSEAKIGIGLYYFAAYCLLSQIAGARLSAARIKAAVQ